ncbi:hypothetical protein [Bacillus sp. AFS029533]|uniref:hypothetical protein n=1 Tax=Bacillus sp. AFS029533 TaxID=2033494 RepID=UPI000BFBD44E|nr:hypothetical protein [Bacillus sp. AFS029533]PGZ90947.1 hypothetical protein COE53_16560 [Bacillus sp. AFS029533]
MIKISSILGVCSSVVSILLWVVLNYFNPYSNGIETDVVTRTAIMLFFPACLALFASLTYRKWLLLVAFIWSLPISLYLALTPGIFAVFGITSLCYLISFIFMLKEKRRKLLNK